MTPQMEARFNEKYGAFWVTRYDANRMRSVGIGKSYPTISLAMTAAKRLEKCKRYRGQFLMIDTQP